MLTAIGAIRSGGSKVWFTEGVKAGRREAMIRMAEKSASSGSSVMAKSTIFDSVALPVARVVGIRSLGWIFAVVLRLCVSREGSCDVVSGVESDTAFRCDDYVLEREGEKGRQHGRNPIAG